MDGRQFQATSASITRLTRMLDHGLYHHPESKSDDYYPTKP
jgi:hypothetical protein